MADTAHTVEQDVTQIKEDIASLKTDMTVIKAEMKYFATKEDIADIKAEMKHFATKADLEAVKGDLRTEIEHMGRTLIMWNISSMIALAGIVVAVVRFMR